MKARLKEYIGFANSDIRNNKLTVNQAYEKVYCLMKTNGFKISKKKIKDAFTYDKLDWELF